MVNKDYSDSDSLESRSLSDGDSSSDEVSSLKNSAKVEKRKREDDAKVAVPIIDPPKKKKREETPSPEKTHLREVDDDGFHSPTTVTSQSTRATPTAAVAATLEESILGQPTTATGAVGFDRGMACFLCDYANFMVGAATKYAKMAGIEYKPVASLSISGLPVPNTTGGGRGPRVPRDPDAPKRPLSSYFTFAKKEFENAKRTNKPSPTKQELSERWRSMTSEQKAPYEKKANKYRQRYLEELKKFNEKKTGIAPKSVNAHHVDDSDVLSKSD